MSGPLLLVEITVIHYLSTWGHQLARLATRNHISDTGTSEQCKARYRHVFSNLSHSFPQLVSWSLQQREYLLNRCLTQLAVSMAYTSRCILFLMPTHCFLDSAGLKYVPWIPTSQLRLESKTVSNQHIKSFQPWQKTIVFNSERNNSCLK